MSYPNILFVDSLGRQFPCDEDGVPFVKQYKNPWRIKINRNWNGGVALAGSSPFPLECMPKNNLWAPPGNLRGDIVRRSGEITAFLTDLEGNPVKNSPKATLRVQPANITEQQMNSMISDIGIMALTTACCVNRTVPVPLGEGAGIDGLGRQWAAITGVLTTATALLDLADVVMNVWTDIENRPLRSFIIEPGLVDIERAGFSPQLFIQKSINPSKRQTYSIKRSESTICVENEFICHVLDYYLKDLASGMADSLSALYINDVSERFIPRNSIREGEGFCDFIAQSRSKIRMVNNQNDFLRKQVFATSDRLRECKEWAKQVRKSDFLKDIRTPQTPSLKSLRLTESPTYGPIYAKFVQIRGEALEPIQKVSYLIENIFQGKVKPTWEIYETWCFAKLYSGLCIYTTLKPREGEAGLFQSLSIHTDGSIEVPKEKEFRLTTDTNSDLLLETVLVYEPRLTNQEGRLRTPDFLVKTKSSGVQKSYYFDAKYRNYKQQGIKTLTEDVIGTARNKYKNGLRANASFILHSDAEVDYWGEVPFNRFLCENLESNRGKSEWVGHEYGAIALIPGQDEDTQLRKIFRLLFQYNYRQMATTCLACGYELTIGQDAHTNWKPDRISEKELANRVLNNSDKAGNGTGIYCSCPKCGDFWVVQSCFGAHHRLLKFNDCFHKISDHLEFKKKWMYICPECGSDPSPEDLRQKY